jgi:hypothetical protein
VKNTNVFAWSMLVAAGIIGLMFIVVRYVFRPEVNGFGIPSELAPFAAATCGSVVGATAIGFRNYVVEMVRILPTGEPLVHSGRTIAAGAGTLYVVGFSGVVAVVGAVLYASAGNDIAESQQLLSWASGIWAASTGYVYEKFFRN